MSRTIVILGAGASVHAGAPTMVDFIDRARRIHRNRVGLAPDDVQHFDRFFKGLSDLQIAHSKSRIDVVNIESVLAAFEFASVIQRFGTYSLEEIKQLADSAKVVIARTLELSMTFKRDASGFPEATAEYRRFASVVKKMKLTLGHSVAVITFNYDIGVDLALIQAGLVLDYALNDSSNSLQVPLLKLHGSLNWGRCSRDDCAVISALEISRFLESVYDSCSAVYEPGVRGGKSVSGVNIRVGSKVDSLQHCRCPVEPFPVIVPPTWNKAQYHFALSNVWARAAKELSEAENILVMGYSLPPSDSFFRDLYALGTIGDTLIEKFWVFDPNKEVEARFRQLIGFGAEQRFRFDAQRFDSGVSIMDQLVAVPD